jgi:hypothetical protein
MPIFVRLASDYEHAVGESRNNQNKTEERGAAIADLIGDGKQDTRKQQMQKRARLAFGEKEKSNHNCEEAGNAQNIK